jgi:ribonuclease VapC
MVPFTDAHLGSALDAYSRYGKGLGRRPHLNFGDCVSYALAKTLDAPLLFKGNDFAATDVTVFS